MDVKKMISVIADSISPISSALINLCKKVPKPPDLTSEYAPTLAVAAIHATVLAIVLGVFSTYGFYRYTQREQLEMKLVQETRAINTIRFDPPFDIPEKAMREAKKLSDPALLRKVVAELGGIIRDGKNVKLAVPPAVPDNAATAQGRRAFHLMLALVLHDPFPEVTTSFSVPTDVDLPDSAAVRRWVDRLEEVTTPLIQAYEFAPRGLSNVLGNIPLQEFDFYPGFLYRTLL